MPTRSLLLAGSTILLACAPQWPRIPAGSCAGQRAYQEGYHRVLRRSALSSEPELSRQQLGSLHVLVSQANRHRVGPLEGANVRVFRGRAASPDSIVRSTRVGQGGDVAVDSLRSAVYFVHARAIGFVGLGDTVAVRPGFRDTVEIQLRTDDNCLER
jgi:hypothetical protein